MTLKILGISGSLRAASFNTALLKASQALLPDGVELEVATLHGIPLYDGDLEAREGLPAAVRALQARIIANDALLLATPEYNAGMPGVLKNALDWLSRGADAPRVFRGRWVALVGATPGGFGTVLSQTHWLPVLRALGCQHWSGGRFALAHAHQALDEHGALRDEAMRKQLGQFLTGFAAAVKAGGG